MLHGIKTNILTAGTRAIAALASGVIGLIVTADDADAAAFPLDTPVLVTDLRAALAKAGTSGTMKPSLEAIYDQTSPILIVVRVAEDDLDQDTAVIGDAGTYTGLYALLAAESVCGVRPRVLGAPGLDTQTVTTALVTVAQKLRGMIYAAGIGDTIADVVLYRANFSARELMLIWPNWSNGFAGDAVARALGLRARIDEETGWHKSISNVAVNGVTGISQSLFFDIQDETTDVSTLNDAEVTALVRSPAGGFIYWGNRTCSDEPLFAFEPAVRTSQILQDEIAQGLVWASDKPLTKFLIKDVLETINARIRSLVVQGRLIGGKAWFDPALNADADLAAGKLVIDYEFTPAAPLEGLTLNQRITDKYYADLAAELAA
ncbi:phage tail sheath subtilisin-like domain-containing protein [Novosphingobium pentaromativorans]|uniref:Phage P2 tail sheath FI-like protein n=1 Tax=Novosphingobium pentaromativorans US6-1 TaxID=1088721 RepID=G6EFH7_9SPHN|nr:phage tail sheath subtilisin-like domain-containing protein [Novosphingobium pentaromativorans]AIT79109.1 tail sheath protein [Novosphingobium pentaromativorans US6-1]EHJ59925.1 Phage P2 tail sheath FI-like protein [Novosphingobium pentaromativorans US6-1]